MRPSSSRWPARVALALAALALAALSGRAPYALDALSAALVPLAGASALAAGVFLALPRPGAAVLAAFAAALAAGGAAEVWTDPARAPAPGPSRGITFATANVFHANPRLPELARALAALEADVLVTQETPRALLDSPGPLADLYPHRRAWMAPGARGGPAIWSRLPFVPDERDRAGGHPNHLIASLDAGLPRPLQAMVLHFASPLYGGQAWQHADFHRFWPLLEAPLVVAGDFNAAPWSATVRRVEDITRTRVLGGHRPTWFGGAGALAALPAPLGLPIDHILVSPGIGAAWARTAPLPGSDHNAVVARLIVALPPP
jgi:endonuclease/exonuclease/phosphatase (EEP) superfamily protein YafD